VKTGGRADGQAGRAVLLAAALVASFCAGDELAAQSTVSLPDRPTARPPVCSSARPACPPASPGSDLTISLMTMGVGERIWERFGHNAILVEDRARGTARAYNYGMFDFGQENFLLNFIQGRMWYWMQGFDLASTLQIYLRANRSVWIQELNLTPAERESLREFLQWNERPENRFYRYDYYRDNCSTRVRDAIDQVIHGRLRAATDTIRTGYSYRYHTARLTAPDPLLYTGIMVGLGEPADQPLTAWEEMFLPLELRKWAGRATVVDESGREVPLVRSERTLFAASEPAPRAVPPRWLPAYLVLGLALGGSLGWLGRRAPESRGARRGFSWLAATWALVGGLAGGMLGFLWAFTDHAIAYRNENLLQASLLLLPLAVLAPAAARGAEWSLRPALALAALAAASSVVGLALKVLPAFGQHNLEVIALTLPANLGLAAGLAALVRRVKA
jgi:hypothetical protein